MSNFFPRLNWDSIVLHCLAITMVMWILFVILAITGPLGLTAVLFYCEYCLVSVTEIDGLRL